VCKLGLKGQWHKMRLTTLYSAWANIEEFEFWDDLKLVEIGEDLIHRKIHLIHKENTQSLIFLGGRKVYTASEELWLFSLREC
jgi:hypothetical protein